jgi:uncharacterized protein (DUF302 family)
MKVQTAYGLRVKTRLPYEQALEKVRQALMEQGFGVLTEIDVRKTLKEKLGADFRRYIILGACNPPLAHRALQAETEIGLLLPCNVIVYEEGEGSVVAAFDPVVGLKMVGNSALDPIAVEVRERLEKALQKLEA